MKQLNKKSKFPELEKAVEFLGGFEAAGRVVRLSGKAVQKWLANGRLPRTEATGETNYSELLSSADSRISKEKLLSSVMRSDSKV